MINLSITNTNKSVLLTWAPPLPYLQDGIITQYTIAYWCSDPRLASSGPVSYVNTTDLHAWIIGQISWGVFIRLHLRSQSHILELLPFVNYSFSVSAWTSIGQSAFQSNASVVTALALPTGLFHFDLLTSSCTPNANTTASMAACTGSEGSVCSASMTVVWTDPAPSTLVGSPIDLLIYQGGPLISYNIMVVATQSLQNNLNLDPNFVNYTVASPLSISTGNRSLACRVTLRAFPQPVVQFLAESLFLCIHHSRPSTVCFL